MTDKKKSEFTEEFKNQAKQFGYDFSQEGTRIKLIHTRDPYTDLKAGALGTIRFRHFNYDVFVVDVKWDNGSMLGLIEGKDSYEVIKEEPEQEKEKEAVKSTFKNDCFGTKEKVSKLKYCEWCWDLALEDKKKKNPVYACCAFGQSGFSSPMTVCRNCLMAIANQEIEHFRTDAIEPIEKLSVEESVQIEVDVIKQIAFEGLE